MIFLGIDPGTKRCGFGLVQKTNGELKLLEAGILKTINEDIPKILEDITNHLKTIIEKHKPSLCAIENIYFFKNIKTGIDVAQSRGAIILTLQKSNIPIIEIDPSQLKSYITGSGHATKADIQKTVEIILKTKIKERDDALDALALAIIASSLKNNYTTLS